MIHISGKGQITHDMDAVPSYNRSMNRSMSLLPVYAALPMLVCWNAWASGPKQNFIWQPERSTSGPILIIVNLDDQVAFVYRNGIQIGQTPVSTGRAGYSTPTGVFSILGKDATHHSKKYDNAPMPFAERLTWSGVFLHAGALPGYPSSHGCVHLPLAFAKDLFEITGRDDTTVVITQTTSKPSDNPAPVEQLLGTMASHFSQPEGADGVLWEPDNNKVGSVALVISGTDKRIEILRGGILIGQGPVAFTDSNSQLPEAIYLKLAPLSGKPSPDWSAVDISGAQTSAPQILSQIQLPQPLASELKKLIVPGTLLITTPGTVTPGNRSATDFVGVQASDPHPPSP
ncbi:MAG TPA: L,D-transpeptidase family protein [Terrimicrobiaceae bacterium]